MNKFHRPNKGGGFFVFAVSPPLAQQPDYSKKSAKVSLIVGKSRISPRRC